jgi:hypothetical protein
LLFVLNNKHMYLKIVIVAFFIPIFCAANNPVPFSTRPVSNNIKTVEVYRSGDPLSYPVIDLNSNETIHISFDELAETDRVLRYHIIHCNSDHLPSGLSVSEYIDGFKTGFIDEYNYSFNTNIPYVHYQLEFPNNETRFRASGCYAVIITGDADDEPLMYAVFYVNENRVDVVPTISYVTETDIRDKNQQVNFAIHTRGFNIPDAHNDLKINIMQNNRTDNIKTGLQPTFLRPGIITYERNSHLIFRGGNEFRYFEGTSTRYNTHGIERIEYHNPYYHLVLYPDAMQSKLSYGYKRDVNGKFFIRRQESEVEFAATEADYVIVHFSIPADEPFFDGKVYLNGNFTYNRFDESCEMKYNFDEKAYYTNVRLKQGRYDYQYLFLRKGEKSAQYEPFENSFFETENDYRIFCYFRSFNDRYDRLIGFVTANSGK